MCSAQRAEKELSMTKRLARSNRYGTNPSSTCPEISLPPI